MADPTKFILNSDYATVKQMQTLTGTLNLAANAGETHQDFTIPNRSVVSRLLMKPSTVNRWFVGAVGIYAADFSWQVEMMVFKLNATTLRVQMRSSFGGATGFIATISYRAVFITL